MAVNKGEMDHLGYVIRIVALVIVVVGLVASVMVVTGKGLTGASASSNGNRLFNTQNG